MHQRLAALACGTGEDPSTERGAKSSGDVEPRSCEASSGLQAKGAGPLVADYARAEDNGLNRKRRSNGLLMLFIALVVGGVGQDPFMHTDGFQTAL